MKRMVENNEKLEELADAVEVNNDNDNVKFNGGLTTSNITTPDGYRLDIFKESDYYGLNYSKLSSLFVFNLGTALIVKGKYDPLEGNGDINVMTLKSDTLIDSSLDIQMLSNGNEIYATYTDNENGTKAVYINFDSNRADVSKSEYQFSFIIGKSFKQL